MSNETDELETIPPLELRDGVRGKHYERYMQSLAASTSPVWRLEITLPFVDALRALPDTAAVASVIAGLLERIALLPQEGALVAGTRVQMVSSEKTVVAGELVPALRLLYVLGHSDRRVELLSAQLAHTELTLPANMSARLEPLLRRVG
jgi:hypothetical protein